ncbi:MAG TPA: thymidine kinase [Candidatus Saccharimonadales bacterium]|nr:thymidine kinase [Candidatus Saccharimonadales bacterium]
MAKLYFRYGAMNSGKTTALIQAAHNYEERGMHAVILKAAVDTKGQDAIVSRLGVQRKADVLIKPGQHVTAALKKLAAKQPFDCVIVDEAQFLEPAQIEELFWYAIEHDTPVLAYGLRSDFQTKGFPGSSRLLELAHEIQELKTICRCGKKALLNARKIDGEFVFAGAQVAIDGEHDIQYESLCGNCYATFRAQA